MALSGDGTMVAVGALSVDGQLGRVTVADAAQGTIFWQSPPLPGTVYVLRFLADGSLVVATSERTYQRLDGRTGVPRWSAIAPP